MTRKSFIGLAVASFMLCACQSDVYQIKGCATQLKDGDTVTLAFEDPPQKVLGQAIVSGGTFKFAGTTDTTLFCRAYLNRQQLTSCSFFLEPGEITIELNQHPRPSRVSGTQLNNQWQALNDTVQKLGTQLIRLAQPVPTPPIASSCSSRSTVCTAASAIASPKLASVTGKTF